jgi:hypothetical protein
MCNRRQLPRVSWSNCVTLKLLFVRDKRSTEPTNSWVPSRPCTLRGLFADQGSKRLLKPGCCCSGPGGDVFRWDLQGHIGPQRVIPQPKLDDRRVTANPWGASSASGLYSCQPLIFQSRETFLTVALGREVAETAQTCQPHPGTRVGDRSACPTSSSCGSRKVGLRRQ